MCRIIRNRNKTERFPEICFYTGTATVRTGADGRTSFSQSYRVPAKPLAGQTYNKSLPKYNAECAAGILF